MARAQVSVVSIILISGIIISLVGVSYMWGAPMIEKQTIITEFNSAANFIKNVEDAVVDIVNTGSGTETLEIPIGSMEVLAETYPDPDNNTITLSFGAGQHFVFGEASVYLGDATFEDLLSEVGVYGEASPSIITLDAVPSGPGYVIQMKLHFRELDTTTTPKKGYKIGVKTPGGRRETGVNKIIISYEVPETRFGQAANTGDLVVTNVMVRVE